MNSVPSAEVARTVAQLFREPAYQWSTKASLFGQFLFWYIALMHRLWHSVSSVPGGAMVAKITAAALVLLLVGTILYRLTAHLWTSRTPHAGGPRTLNGDPWHAAERCAQSGAYVEAAHWLYIAVVRSLVARAGVRFHPSKTAGDYLRELRRLNRRETVDRFLPFVRAYEIIAYRDGRCDATEYAHLRALAESTQPLHRTAA